MKSKYALAALLVVSLSLYAFIGHDKTPSIDLPEVPQAKSELFRSDTLSASTFQAIPVHNSFQVPKATDVSWHVRDFQ